MNFFRGAAQVRTLVGSFVSNRRQDDQETDNAALPDKFHMWRAVIRYTVRLSLLMLILFIFIWWPVDSFNPEGFDAWSQRMTDLPPEVWVLISTILLFWATGEIMAQRADSRSASITPIPPAGDTFIGDEQFIGEPMGGRFDLLNQDDEEFFNEGSQPNQVIEEWRAGETPEN